MTWGCKAKPNGCGWASTLTYPGSGQQEWWCDLCERSGERMVSQGTPEEQARWRGPAVVDLPLDLSLSSGGAS